MHASGFRHEILPYGGDRDGLLKGVAPLIRESLAAGAPVLVAVRRRLIDALREELGDDSRRVQFRDIQALGRNPARIIPAWSAFLEREKDAPDALGVGEPVWPARSDAELGECEVHENLLNTAFEAGRSWKLVCPYDTDHLDDDVIERAKRTHAYLRREGVSERNDSFGRERSGWPALAGQLPAPRSDQVLEMRFGDGDLARVRAFVSTQAQAAGLSQAARDDLVLAASELATNSIRYGGGGGLCRIWSEGANLLCEFSDSGQIRSPLAGRVRPDPEQVGGRGLWVVNQICELVQLRSDEDGTVVRIHTHVKP